MDKKIFLGIIIILVGLFLITFSVIKQSAKISVTPNQKPIIESGAIILPVSESDPFYGNPGSAITVDEFFGFNCEKCIVLHDQLVSFANSNPGKIRLRATGILKTNWIGQQENSLPFLALSCATNQDNYWPFLNKAIKMTKFDETTLTSVAEELKLNMVDFGACLKNEGTKMELQNKQTSLQSAGFVETPLIFINNKQVNLNDNIKIIEILNNVVVK